ncbi:MAG TPA: hypothetical protein VFT32_12855 [Candidatus Eisenbacteria bacterium]|nr:hypothetical protein [Candidatus Eisenbacteria bacterium]
MTSRRRRLHAQGWAALAAALALAAGHPRAAGAGSADSASVAPAAAPDSAAGVSWVSVVTLPPGLRVFVNGIDAGTSPVETREVRSGLVVVRAFAPDPRRFEPDPDGAVATLAPGESLHVRLDLRPRILLRSVPEPAAVALLAGGAGALDTSAGETPLRLAPARLETARVRFGVAGYADSMVPGSDLVARAAAGAGGVTIALRSLHLPPPAPPPRPSLFGRGWFRWALIGTGAALTGTAAILRHEGDRTYDRYLAETRPDEIERLYDRTVRYDRWSSITLGAGQASLTAGLFLLMTGVGR